MSEHSHKKWTNWEIASLAVINGIILFLAVLNTLCLYHSLFQYKSTKQASKLPFDLAKKITNEPMQLQNKSVYSLQPSRCNSTACNSTISINTSVTPNSQLYYRRESVNKKLVIGYFYIIVWIPLFISLISFYGVLFPNNVMFILPFLNIVTGVVFLVFIQMLILSSDGWYVIQHYLESERDLCCHGCMGIGSKNRAHKIRIHTRSSLIKQHTRSPHRVRNTKRRCCIQANAYQGLKCKIKLCYLILLKPLLNYGTAYFQYVENVVFLANMCHVIGVFTCVIPIICMDMIHEILKPYTKIGHTHIKMMSVVCLAPLCQLQQSLIAFLFHWGIVTESNCNVVINNTLAVKDQWPCLYGVVICWEMVFISIIITWKAFPVHDLVIWDKLDTLMRARGNSEVSMNIGVTVEPDSEPSFE
eukprot:59337_1